MFNWCRDNSLNLNVKKTKEMLIDFIDGMKAERVTSTNIQEQADNKLNFNKNTDFIHKRCPPSISFAFKS